MDLMPPDFYRQAACRDADPELFFDLDYESTPHRHRPVGEDVVTHAARKTQRRTTALEYCDGCPVREACRINLGTVSTDGVFGGQSQEDRRRLKRKPGPHSRLLRSTAIELLERGHGIREVMDITGLDYLAVMEIKAMNAPVGNDDKDADAPEESAA